MLLGPPSYPIRSLSRVRFWTRAAAIRDLTSASLLALGPFEAPLASLYRLSNQQLPVIPVY